MKRKNYLIQINKTIILITIISLIFCLYGCQKKINNPDNIDCHTFEYKGDTEFLKENGVIFGNNGVLFNSDIYDEFMEAVNNGQEAHADFAAITYEGKWIISCVSFDGDHFTVIKDSSRDNFSHIDVSMNTYDTIRDYIQDGFRTIDVTNSDNTELETLVWYN